MRASTLLYQFQVNNIVDSEAISKLLLCYYKNISDNLVRLQNLDVRKDLNYINEYIESSYKPHTIVKRNTNELISKHKDINLKKHDTIEYLFSSPKQYCNITNYIYPPTVTDVVGPYLTNKYILFYNTVSNILMVFTFVPMNYALHNVKNYKSDILVRDLNCYVLDNVSEQVFTEYVLNNIVNKDPIDYIENILKYNSVSIKIGEYKDKVKTKVELLRSVKEEFKSINKYINTNTHPFYKWEIIEPYSIS